MSIIVLQYASQQWSRLFVGMVGTGCRVSRTPKHTVSVATNPGSVHYLRATFRSRINSLDS